MFPQVPAILLCCQEYDELKVPSSPPRRLSRSSIDLRDLEAQHEREKIMSQNVSESVSSIYHCFDSQIRYSESEPINAHIKALENQFGMKSGNSGEEQQPDKNHQHQQQQLSAESKSSMNNFSFMNNFEHTTMATGTTKESSDMNLISSASIIKDNHHQVNANNNNNNGSSGNSSNNGKRSFKKMLASSDSDFFSLLRYNSVKLRRMNCFSIGSTNGSGHNHGGGGGSGGQTGVGGDSCSTNGNKPKNMIYALSDSDFLIRVSSDNNKTFHLNNERKLQAIVNKSDIFNYLNKSFDHNLLDYNSAQHNQNKLTDKPFHGDLEFFNADKLKKVFEESQQKIDADDNNVINASSNNSASIISSEKLQKKETVSLPPLVNSTSNDINLKLNNSRSIDTVLLNIKNSNNADKLYTFKLLHDFSPKAINQEENLNKNLLKDSIQRQSTVMTTSSGSDVDIQPPPPNAAASTLTPNNGNNNNNNHSSLSIPAVDNNALPPLATMSSHLLKPVNLNDSSLNGQQQNLLDLPSIDSNSMNPAFLDEGRQRRRTASTVTYNVNVIDFHSEDEPHYSGGGGSGGGHGGYGTGKRSNSSTSK
jgi:hypothetical protein